MIRSVEDIDCDSLQNSYVTVTDQKTNMIGAALAVCRDPGKGLRRRIKTCSRRNIGR